MSGSNVRLARKVLSAVVLAAAVLMPSPAFAGQAADDVVKAKGLLSRSAVRPGETFKTALILKVQSGYHINDNAPLDEFMIPTNIIISENPDFEIIEISYPRGRRARFSYSEVELVVYEGEVVIGALVKAKDGLAAGPRSLKGVLTYQACNDELCLPPKELAFEIAVPVSATGACIDTAPEIFDKIPFRTLPEEEAPAPS